MSKDLFDYIVTPTEKEFRKVNSIDDIYGIPHLIIPQNAFFFHPMDYLINDAIVNYNNEIVVLKTFYATMMKYQKYYKRTKEENYDFWARKYGEQAIKELYSIYDKSMHILNYLYDLKLVPDMNFKTNIRMAIKEKDKSFYRKINSVYSRLFGDSGKNSVRDNITHNFSDMFVKYKPQISDGKPTGWHVEEPLMFEEYKKIIDEICSLLAENKDIIVKKISEIYPPKGTIDKKKRQDEIFEKLIGSD